MKTKWSKKLVRDHERQWWWFWDEMKNNTNNTTRGLREKVSLGKIAIRRDF